MSVNPLDFWESAKQTFGVATIEVDYRNTSSRTYYSAFHVALSTANKNKYPEVTAEGGEHEAIIQRLTKLINKHPHAFLARSAGILLSQMRKDRVKADYKIAENYIKDYSQLQLDAFDTFMGKISEIDKLSSQTQK